MRLLATADVMRGFDRAAIERFNIPGILLMENAGRCCVETILHRFGDLAGKHVVIVCGKGNNGGDGFVIARHLLNRKARVSVLLLAPPARLAGDAAMNFTILRRLERAARGDLRISRVSPAASLRTYDSADFIVDAIFGTGFSGVPDRMAAEVIRWINRREVPVIAVDVPSGVDATTGEAGGDAVRAHLTVTMACDKIGLHVGTGRELSGKVEIADISIPHGAVTIPRSPTFLVEHRDIESLLPPRPLNANKYSVGKVLVVAGSRSFTGAPVLAALSALRAGAGAVVLCVPQSIHGMLVRKMTDVVLTPCKDTPAGTLATDALAEIQQRLSWADVVVLGPGLSRHEETDALCRTLVATVDRPLVLDADGLNAVASNLKVLRGRKIPAILTPHTGELVRLIGGESGTHDRLRVDSARQAALSTGSIVVLKGAPTVTANKRVAVLNSTGNPGMATIGSGDVLSGLIAGLIGQKVPIFEAAYAGVYLHGMAGDLAARKFGQRGILASDILDNVPLALKEVAS